MMDPAVKIALALSVFLTGVCAAMLFRRERPPATPPVVEDSQQLFIRYRTDGPAPGARQRLADRAGRTPRHAPAAPATVVTPLDRHEPPPSLASDFPAADRPADSRWGASLEMMLPAAAPTRETARTHTVVDGDTLAALAERYLGSADRANEIYEANRDVLGDPGLLPIGVELKLPPRSDL